MTEAVLERMQPLWAEFEDALRADPSYCIELASVGSRRYARKHEVTEVNELAAA